MNYDIYGDIATRTDGEIYIGVVGPVRTGKSTFITRFMEEMVLPNMATRKKSVAIDEMPQSASGKTVMTTEPKFVPSEAVNVRVGKKSAKVRLIDCVGYMVDGALGAEENGEARLVKTPWQEAPMPFKKAAEYGTKKVIEDHSTIGIVVTSDGSFTDIKREAYATREEQVINELKCLNKPFIVVFNTSKPDDDSVKKACFAIEKKHNVSVVAADVSNIKKEGLEEILSKVLEEFPLKTIDLDIPRWMQLLPPESEIIMHTVKTVREAVSKVSKMKNAVEIEKMFDGSDIYEPISEMEMDMATGNVKVIATAKNGVFYKAVSEAACEEIPDELSLMNYIKELSVAKAGYDKVKTALTDAEESGYGIVGAELDMKCSKAPEVVKKAGQYSVKMRVESKSLHIIRADLVAEINPVYGSKKQCEDFVSLMGKEGYQAEVFGRRLSEIVSEELYKKCVSLPDGMRTKLKRVVTKAVNENKSNLICLLV